MQLSILGNAPRYCDGIARRELMKVGALSFGGMTLSQLLRLRSAGAATGGRAKAAILVFLAGGPSHFETFDPKPDAPREIRGPYGPISTNVPGLMVCETMSNFAKIAEQFSLIRSCCHTNSGHGGGQRWVMTGHPSASLEDELPHDYPQIGPIVARLKGAARRGLPANVRIPPGRGDQSAYLGPAYSPLQVYSTGRPTGIELTNLVKLDRLEDRRRLRSALDGMNRVLDDRGLIEGMDSLEQQAFDLVAGKAAKNAFDLKQEPAANRDRYGDHDAGRSCLLARRLVEAGVTFVTVRMGSWDHHGNAGGTITSGMKDDGQPFNQAVPALIADLHERGLSDDVLVVVWGEFGRTPRINKFVGRDHWPQAMSVLLAGGGLRMGQVIGSTNRRGEQPLDSAVGPADVLATLYRQLGIDYTHHFINSSGRPVPVLPTGTPIAGLL